MSIHPSILVTQVHSSMFIESVDKRVCEHTHICELTGAQQVLTSQSLNTKIELLSKHTASYYISEKLKGVDTTCALLLENILIPKFNYVPSNHPSIELRG